MKAQEFLARQWVEKHGSSAQSIEDVAYLDGFRKAKELAAGLIEGFDNPKFKGLAILIRAIGTVNVDPETGERSDR
jgi:hypothetical protein